MSSRRAPAMRPMIFAPAMIGKAVFREGGARVGGQLDDLRVELAADPEGLDEQEVARDEGVLQSELLVRGHAAAAHLAAVVDVVVDQGRGVDELQGRGEVDRLRGVHAAAGPEETALDSESNYCPRAASPATSMIARVGTVPLLATALIVGAIASRNVWIMSSRLPIQSAIITTGIMIVMNG